MSIRRLNRKAPNPRFTNRMIAFLDAISGQNLFSTSTPPTITGTKVTGSSIGLARGFGATDGVSTTDALRFGSSALHSNAASLGAVSFAIRVVIRGAGGGSFGRFLVKGPVGVGGGSLQCYYSAATYNPGVTLSVFDTSGSSVIDRTWPIPAFGTPLTMVFVAYGGGSSNGDLWINGTRIATSAAASTGGGSEATSTDPWYIGNRGDGLRNFEGIIAGVIPIWNRALTASEAQAISANFDLIYANSDQPIFIPTVTVTGIYKVGSDETTANWTATPGPAYFDAIDESVASDTDFVTSPNLGITSINNPLVMGLSGTVPAGTWGLKVRTLHEAGTDRRVHVLLLNSSNQIVGQVNYIQTLRDAFELRTINVTTNGPATKVVLTVANDGQTYTPPYSYFTP